MGEVQLGISKEQMWIEIEGLYQQKPGERTERSRKRILTNNREYGSESIRIRHSLKFSDQIMTESHIPFSAQQEVIT